MEDNQKKLLSRTPLDQQRNKLRLFFHAEHHSHRLRKRSRGSRQPESSVWLLEPGTPPSCVGQPRHGLPHSRSRIRSSPSCCVTITETASQKSSPSSAM